MLGHCSSSLARTIRYHKKLIWDGLVTLVTVFLLCTGTAGVHRQIDKAHILIRELLSWQGLLVSCWARWSQPSCRTSWGLRAPWPQDGPPRFRISRTAPVKSEHTKALASHGTMANRQKYTSTDGLRIFCILFKSNKCLPPYNSVVKLHVSPSIASIHREPITLQYRQRKKKKKTIFE